MNRIKPRMLAHPTRVAPFVGLGAALEHVSYSCAVVSVGVPFKIGGSAPAKPVAPPARTPVRK